MKSVIRYLHWRNSISGTRQYFSLRTGSTKKKFDFLKELVCICKSTLSRNLISLLVWKISRSCSSSWRKRICSRKSIELTMRCGWSILVTLRNWRTWFWRKCRNSVESSGLIRSKGSKTGPMYSTPLKAVEKILCWVCPILLYLKMLFGRFITKRSSRLYLRDYTGLKVSKRVFIRRRNHWK